jgi:hypothetical protein
MLHSTHVNNPHTQSNPFDIDLFNTPSYTKRFIRFVKLMVFVLVFQSFFDDRREKEVEIEEEILEIQFNILPTFLVKREKIT